MIELLVIWVILLGGIGIYFLALSLTPFLRYTKAKKWPKVPGKITHVFSDYHWFALGNPIDFTDTMSIKYEFQYDGKINTSSNISLDPEPSLIQLKEGKKGFYVKHLPSFVKNLERNPDVVVWVNPNNHLDSILVNYQAVHAVKVFLGAALVIWSLGLAKICLSIGHIELQNKVIILEKKSIEEIEKFEEERMNR